MLHKPPYDSFTCEHVYVRERPNPTLIYVKCQGDATIKANVRHFLRVLCFYWTREKLPWHKHTYFRCFHFLSAILQLQCCCFSFHVVVIIFFCYLEILVCVFFFHVDLRTGWWWKFNEVLWGLHRKLVKVGICFLKVYEKSLHKKKQVQAFYINIKNEKKLPCSVEHEKLYYLYCFDYKPVFTPTFYYNSERKVFPYFLVNDKLKDNSSKAGK